MDYRAIVSSPGRCSAYVKIVQQQQMGYERQTFQKIGFVQSLNGFGERDNLINFQQILLGIALAGVMKEVLER